jgi:S-adenosyl-L-methionine hydrolase (adenosine-forming)
VPEPASTADEGGHGFLPCGVVTLITDFGITDPFVGAMKGRILQHCAAAQCVDLTHGITPFRPAEAAFWLEHLRHDFPPGTIHVAVVDPGVGTARRLLAVCLGDQLFLGPDNGLLGGLARQPGAQARAVAAEMLDRLSPSPSATFHGRDLLAPLAGRLAGSLIAFDDLGSVVSDSVESPVPDPRVAAGMIQGEVLLVDHYGNLFSNIDLTLVVNNEIRSVRFGARELPWKRTYRDAQPGECIALLNAFGVIEAACVEGRASDVLQLGPGAPVSVGVRPSVAAAAGHGSGS